jgi:hypothetical protein
MMTIRALPLNMAANTACLRTSQASRHSRFVITTITTTILITTISITIISTIIMIITIIGTTTTIIIITITTAIAVTHTGHGITINYYYNTIQCGYLQNISMDTNHLQNKALETNKSRVSYLYTLLFIAFYVVFFSHNLTISAT